MEAEGLLAFVMWLLMHCYRDRLRKTLTAASAIKVFLPGSALPAWSGAAWVFGLVVWAASTASWWGQALPLGAASASHEMSPQLPATHQVERPGTCRNRRIGEGWRRSGPRSISVSRGGIIPRAGINCVSRFSPLLLGRSIRAAAAANMARIVREGFARTTSVILTPCCHA